jgi:hypothetical protein
LKAFTSDGGPSTIKFGDWHLKVQLIEFFFTILFLTISIREWKEEGEKIIVLSPSQSNNNNNYNTNNNH